MLLSYVMRKEMEKEDEKAAAAFKDNLFAHAFANQNPELFVKLYPEQYGVSAEEEAELEWEIPESVADIARMLSDLRETGWQG